MKKRENFSKNGNYAKKNKISRQINKTFIKVKEGKLFIRENKTSNIDQSEQFHKFFWPINCCSHKLMVFTEFSHLAFSREKNFTKFIFAKKFRIFRETFRSLETLISILYITRYSSLCTWHLLSILYITRSSNLCTALPTPSPVAADVSIYSTPSSAASSWTRIP